MKIKQYGPAVLRIGMALVFLWFGINQLIDPSIWTGYIPEFITNMGIAVETVVIVNGIFEVIFGLLLGLGLFTRIVALLLGLHLIGISFAVGYGAIFVRDLGLAIATLSIALTGPDKFCLKK